MLNLNLRSQVPGCDNHILYLLDKEGYHIENFCYDVKSHHLHSTAFRTYNEKTTRIGDRSVYHYVEPRRMKLREPSSFCTVATIDCIDEFIAHVCSVHRWHPDKKIYAMVDTETIKATKAYLPFLFDTTLNLFAVRPRDKTAAIERALEFEADVMYLDANTLVFHKLYVDPEYEIGVSPHMLWTRESDFSGLKRFEFDESYNVSHTANNFNIAGGPCVGEKFIKCVHTHFANPEYQYFNHTIIQMLLACGRFVEISLIERILNKRWILFRPKGSTFQIANKAADVHYVDDEKIQAPCVGQFRCKEEGDEWNAFLQRNILGCLF